MLTITFERQRANSLYCCRFSKSLTRGRSDQNASSRYSSLFLGYEGRPGSLIYVQTVGGHREMSQELGLSFIQFSALAGCHHVSLLPACSFFLSGQIQEEGAQWWSLGDFLQHRVLVQPCLTVQTHPKFLLGTSLRVLKLDGINSVFSFPSQKLKEYLLLCWVYTGLFQFFPVCTSRGSSTCISTLRQEKSLAPLPVCSSSSQDCSFRSPNVSLPMRRRVENEQSGSNSGLARSLRKHLIEVSETLNSRSIWNQH